MPASASDVQHTGNAPQDHWRSNTFVAQPLPAVNPNPTGEGAGPTPNKTQPGAAVPQPLIPGLSEVQAPCDARGRVKQGAPDSPPSKGDLGGCSPKGHQSGYVAALAAAAVAMAVYWCTLAPSITGDDSGEFVTAAYTLGIPHPPGYPLWCLLAHAFTHLPFGTVAWRVNLMSAVFGAATVFVVAHLILMVTRNRLAAFAGAVALAFSREFWEQSLITEVYTLNAFFIALCLWLVWRWHEHRNDRTLYLFALAYGLSLANHNTMVVLGPVFALYILCVDGWSAGRWPIYAKMLGLAALGSLVYLYLPLRSMANPPMDWGNPETLSNFWGVVRREQYAFMVWQYPRGLERFCHQMAVWGAFWLREFTPLLAPIGLLGLGILLRRRTGHALLLLAIGLVTVLSATLMQNFGFDREWRWVMTVFGIPAYMVTAVGIGVALDWLYQWYWGRYMAWALAATCVVVLLSSNGRHNNLSRYQWTEDYAKNLLTSMEEDAIFIPEADHQSFPATYMQAVEGLRKDITIGRKYGYIDMGLVPDLPEDRKRIMGEFPPRRYEPEIFAWLLAHTGRPVYFSKPPKLSKESGIRFQRAGLLHRALRPGETPLPRDYWAWYRWHALEPADTRGDHTAALILYEITMADAAEAFAKGDPFSGARHIEEALVIYGRDVTSLNNAGVACARAGLREQARAYFQEALNRSPNNFAAQSNSARIDGQ